MLDQLAYNKTDLRTTTAKVLAEERASEVIISAYKCMKSVLGLFVRIIKNTH